ncbi:MAG: hypothetical protein JJ892_06355 [Balneola sp.]|nr:hypothetical protein [Balneola sp.]MBO6649961.1 hypothetical protein [Balneola sp.]MBO6711689.1 hypothetical protein [Balneola sp.]MBO6799885.1 hypothetical protein [Balneola sp.]MBO6871128.1 hypothetical protein [Balneola sp.]
MQKVIDQITDKFIGQIGTERPFYSPQQLLKAEIPVYIVERIRLLLEDKVLSDLKKTDSVWVDTENKLFVSAQNDFENVAISCSVIPHQKLYDILHATVSDIVSVLVEPRKNIAPYIFREETVLSFEEVSKRCARLMVYKHFGTAIPLYMKKRELDELTIERCQSLVSNLDARIVSDYTAENWSQKLEMLFSLCGGKLAPELLQRFFRDKGFDNTADIFSSIDVAVTQSTFIEMLSTENFKMELIKEQESETKPVSESAKPAEVAEEAKEKIPEDTEEEEENLASLFQSEAVEPDINEILGDIEQEETLVFDSVDDSESLNNIFLSEDENDDAEEEHSEPVINQKEENQAFKSNLTSILDQAKDSYEGVVQGDEEFESELIEEDDLIQDAFESDEETKDPILEEHIGSDEEDSSEDEEEKPMWAQFLSEDQMEVMMASREEEEEPESEPTYNTLLVEDEDDEIFMEEVAVEDSSATMELNEYLMDSEDRWVSDVFSGKQKAYDRGINELGQFDNWNEASVFLQQEIFSKQKVDMFSEEASEFIDTLQSYFKEYKS